MVISLLFCSYFFALSQRVSATVTGQRTRRPLSRIFGWRSLVEQWEEEVSPLPEGCSWILFWSFPTFLRRSHRSSPFPPLWVSQAFSSAILVGLLSTVCRLVAFRSL